MSKPEEPSLIRIIVPGEPKGVGRVNARAVTNKKTGKTFASVYTPTPTRTEAGFIRLLAANAMNGRPPLSGPIYLRIIAYMGMPKSMTKKARAQAMADPPALFPTKKPDFDNIAKFVDAITGIVWNDDVQVVDAHIYKRYSEIPRLVIEVRKKT